MSTVPKWRLAGDWFDICSCDIPCPCEFAQAPTNNACMGMLAWHIREGHYGEVGLEGLNLVALAAFEGNIWSGEAKLRMGLFIDERADEPQRQVLQTVFSGQAGGWPATIASMMGEFKGVEFMPISFEIADDLAFWQAGDSGSGARSGRGPQRADYAARTTGADDQSPWLGGRPRPGCDLGQLGRSANRRLRIQMDWPKAFQQAHPVRLDRT